MMVAPAVLVAIRVLIRKTIEALFLVTVAANVSAEILPGFVLREITVPDGFVTSLAFDADGVLHFTTTDGGIWRHEAGANIEIARVDTVVEGNAALLGMAFARDGTIVVHYVASDRSADLISRIDPVSGEESLIARLACSFGKDCPTEHHGGNPIVTDDGTIFVGIGDWGLVHIGQRDDLNAAKIFRITEDGAFTVWAKGFRNPFDLGWDSRWERLIAGDNGIGVGDDELLFVKEGENHGWPLTMGGMPPVEGTTPPAYVFPERTAPTGLMVPDSETGWFRQGILVTSFVTRALYYFPTYDETSVAPPLEIFRDETTALIDVRQSPDGELFLATGFAIYHLESPRPGDVDGDGKIDRSDYDALLEELSDGEGGPTVRVQEGDHRASWGADVDQNGIVDRNDLVKLSVMLNGRRRPVRHLRTSDRRRPVDGIGRD